MIGNLSIYGVTRLVESIGNMGIVAIACAAYLWNQTIAKEDGAG